MILMDETLFICPCVEGDKSAKSHAPNCPVIALYKEQKKIDQRKLEFRAWDDNKKKFHEFGLWNLDGEFHVPDLCTISDMPIEQFTGLQDKNKKEIYEGDLVLIRHPQAQEGGDFYDTIGVVYWDKAEAQFCHSSGCGRPPKRMWEHVQVVGNIHENDETPTAELIKRLKEANPCKPPSST